MALDLSALLAGLGQLSTGFQQGASESFTAKQQQGEQQRQNQQDARAEQSLRSLLALRDLQSQGVKQDLAPAPDALLGEVASTRSLSPDVLAGTTNRQLGQRAGLFPLATPELSDHEKTMQALDRAFRQSQIARNRRAPADRAELQKRQKTENLISRTLEQRVRAGERQRQAQERLLKMRQKLDSDFSAMSEAVKQNLIGEIQAAELDLEKQTAEGRDRDRFLVGLLGQLGDADPLLMQSLTGAPLSGPADTGANSDLLQIK